MFANLAQCVGPSLHILMSLRGRLPRKCVAAVLLIGWNNHVCEVEQLLLREFRHCCARYRGETQGMGGVQTVIKE